MFDEMFDTMHDEFANYLSTSNAISETSQSTHISEIHVSTDTEQDLRRNSLRNFESVKASTSSKQDFSADKQSSSNKRKSSHIVQNSNVIKTGNIIKSYKIVKKSKVNGHILKSSTSFSRDPTQETPYLNGENPTDNNNNNNTSIHTSQQESHQVETGLNESIFMNEMELNKAMFGVFFDGNSKYFVCDIEKHGLNKNKPYYKVYNVLNSRLYKKSFNEFSDFRYHFIMPLKFDSSVTVNMRVLVVWFINDHYLTPATIKELYPQTEQVEVQNNKGQSAVISIYDVFILPNHMPIMSDVSDVSEESNSTLPPDTLSEKIFRTQPDMDIVFNNYAEHKQKYTDEKKKLEGVWRWADKIDNCSFVEPVDCKLVTANRFQSVWKNNRIKFSVGDDVLIWDEKEKPTYKYPIIGHIKMLYENVVSKQKRLEFSWYLHPAEYPDSNMKPLNVSIYLLHKYT